MCAVFARVDTVIVLERQYFGLFSGVEDGEHNGVCFVGISRICYAEQLFSWEQNYLTEYSKLMN